jgi:hypothetical protein
MLMTTSNPDALEIFIRAGYQAEPGREAEANACPA